MMRVLITSKDHPNYNETGTIVRDLRTEGIEVELDRSTAVVLVPEKQWKVISLQEDKKKGSSEGAGLAAYGAAEGVLGVLGDIIS
jgi:hypothetical protein